MTSLYEQMPEVEILTKEKSIKEKGFGEQGEKKEMKERDFLRLSNEYGRLAYLELRRFMEATGAKISQEREEEMAEKLKIDGITKRGNPIVIEAIKNSCLCFGDFCLSPQGEEFKSLEKVEKYNQEIQEGKIGEGPVKKPEEYLNLVAQWLEKQPVVKERINAGQKIVGYRNPYSQDKSSIWACQQLALAHLTGFGEAAHLLGDKETYKLTNDVLEEILKKS